MSDLHYQGDPKMVLDENGSDLVYKDGQPVMDRGLENLAVISLFTKRGWPGNALFKLPDEKYGSDFLVAHEQPINRTALNNIRDKAEKALSSPIFGNVVAVTTNPTASIVRTLITIQPPGSDIQTLLVERNGLNWVSQIVNPAHRRV